MGLWWYLLGAGFDFITLICLSMKWGYEQNLFQRAAGTSFTKHLLSTYSVLGTVLTLGIWW